MPARSAWVVAVATSSSKNPWRDPPGGQGDVRQWVPPDLGGSRPAKSRSDRVPQDVPAATAAVPTLEEIEAIQKQAYDEGYEQGKKEGFDFGHRESVEQSRKDIAAKLAKLDALLAVLDGPFKELDDQVEQELLTLVVAMVRQLVRREVRTDPNQIIGVMREAMAILPLNARDIRVMLHPEDAEIVRELYTVTDTDLAWKIQEDPVLQRGGCRIVTETSQVDATLESRLHNLIAPLIGGLRSEDQDVEDEL
jgi:flagellar assembly protein FliH